MAKLGDLTVRLGLDTATFSDRLKKAQSNLARKMKKMRSALSALSKPIGLITGALGLLGGVSFGALIRSTLASVDALAKQADRLGVTTEALRGYRLAANLAGASNGDLEKGIQKLNKNIGDVSSGLAAETSAVALAFGQIGLSADELKSKKPEEAFDLVVQKLSEIPDVATRTSASMAILGKSGANLGNLIQGGAAGLQSAKDEAIALGAALTRVDAAKIEMANDATERLKTAFEGFVNQLTVQMAPLLTMLADGITDLAKRSGGFGVMLGGVVEKGVVGFAAVLRGALALRAGILTIGAGLAIMTVKIKEFAERGAAWIGGFIADSLTLVYKLKLGFQVLWQKVEIFGQEAAAGVKLVWAKMLDFIQVKLGKIMEFAGSKLVNIPGMAEQGMNLALAGRDVRFGANNERTSLAESAEKIKSAQAELAALREKSKFIEEQGKLVKSVWDKAGADAKASSDAMTAGIGDQLYADLTKWQYAPEKLTAAWEQSRATIEANAQAIADNAANNIDASTEATTRNIAAMTQKAKAAQTELENLQKKAHDLLQTDKEKLTEEVSGWQKLRDAGRISAEQFDQLVQKSRQGIDSLKTTWERAGEAMSSAFQKFAETGEFNFKKFTRSIIANMALIKAKAGFAQIFARLGGGKVVDGQVLGGGSTGFGGIFSGLARGILGSFDGGGYTGDGSRSGGLDGKGGFMAMLHPQETVVDHTKMTPSKSGGGVVNNFVENITVSPGVSRDELRVTLQELERIRDEKQQRMISTGAGVYSGMVEA